jgi:hypothetical protein
MRFSPALVIFLLIIRLEVHGQDNLSEYLKDHAYSFTLEKGFTGAAADTLGKRLKGYKLILQAEGGSHFLNFYAQLPLTWLRFLHERLNLTHFFLEAGHSSDILMNRYLQTGDTSLLYTSDHTFWKRLYVFNQSLPKEKRINYFGIDFESRKTYVQALKLLLPVNDPPKEIAPAITIIRNASDTVWECEYITGINKQLRKAHKDHQADFQSWLAEKYPDFRRMVMNGATCNDAYNNRNKNMAANFLSFDQEFQQPVYFGELGEAHTILKNKNAASIINNSPGFKERVCVINLYCYHCSTAEETVSNWPLDKIEKDILDYFLPLCTSGFTLFDLTEDIELTKKYRAYGQFLIIAKDQN